jgi:outer membrane protein OmpA-like peptidoglycan-associated protein
MEINRYKTNPLKEDTDGDNLSDGLEVNQYKTDPLKADTDGDALNDYAELMTHRTNPLKIDTDAGGMNDGAEIKAGRNPLDSADDLLDLTQGNKIVLEGIQFASAQATILPESAIILEKVQASMLAFPDVKVTIAGHTDSVGSDDNNRTLSLKRAQAVKDWLVAKKISAARIKVVGKGEAEPIATNDTAEGRAKNRRIEFIVD